MITFHWSNGVSSVINSIDRGNKNLSDNNCILRYIFRHTDRPCWNNETSTKCKWGLTNVTHSSWIVIRMIFRSKCLLSQTLIFICENLKCIVYSIERRNENAVCLINQYMFELFSKKASKSTECNMVKHYKDDFYKISIKYIIKNLRNDMSTSE